MQVLSHPCWLPSAYPRARFRIPLSFLHLLSYCIAAESVSSVRVGDTFVANMAPESVRTRQVFSLLRLRAMATILLQDAHTLLPSNALQTIAVGSDGRTMLAAPLPGCGDGSEGGWALMRGSIFCDENALRQPHVSVSLHRHEIPAPLHPSKAEGDDREAGAGGGVGLLGGLMSKLKDGLQKDDMNVLESILCVCEATEEEREGAHGKTIDEQERSRQDRRLLLAGGKRSIDKGSDVGDAAAATDTRGLAAKSGAAGAAVRVFVSIRASRSCARAVSCVCASICKCVLHPYPNSDKSHACRLRHRRR